MTEVTEIKIPARADYVGVVRLTVAGIMSRLPYTAEQIEDAKVALSEACTNVVQYAYPRQSKNEKSIYITVKAQKKFIEFIVRDNGAGFNVTRPPRRPVHDGDIHMGLGLVFMKSLMDDVKITSNKKAGTTVTMLKKVKS